MHTHNLLHVQTTVVTPDCVAHRYQEPWEYVCVRYSRHALIFVLFTWISDVRREYSVVCIKKNTSSNMETSTPPWLRENNMDSLSLFKNTLAFNHRVWIKIEVKIRFCVLFSP